MMLALDVDHNISTTNCSSSLGDEVGSLHVTLQCHAVIDGLYFSNATFI